jgi:hypothetical protein
LLPAKNRNSEKFIDKNMKNHTKTQRENAKTGLNNSRDRRFLIGLMGAALLSPLIACGKGRNIMQKEIDLSVVLWSYVDRTITEITFNGTGLGLSGAYGGTGIITGVRIPFGAQNLSWKLDGPEGMARNGETVHMKNKIAFNASDVPPGTRYLGIHVYPDETAEMAFSQAYPGVSARGEKIRRERK